MPATKRDTGGAAGLRKGNGAPKTVWRSEILACETRRQRLFIDGKETPFFIDTAAHHAHRTQGDKHGLFGAGMGPIPSGQRHGLRIALMLASGDKIALLKHWAEQMADGSP